MRQILFIFTFLTAATVLSSFSLASPEEVGKAGYYADSLHGRKTASGEKYDKNEFTCAHKSLPFGTKVRVTRLDNKKSVVVRVNDRGPFVDGFVVDISRSAAEQIGLVKDGVTRVKVEVVEAAANARVAAETDGNTKLLVARDAASKQSAKGITSSSKTSKAVMYNSNPQTSGGSGGITTELFKVDLKKSERAGYGVQVSTLYDADNVIPELKKLQALWPGKSLVLVEKNEADNSAKYKLILGPFTDKASSESQQKLAAKKGYKGCFIVALGDM